MKETIEFVPNERRRQKIKELIKEGYHYFCLRCHKIYKEPRKERYETGYGSRLIDMCSCGCDLFKKLEDVSCLDVKVEPVDGTLVFKEHHAKYCKCDVGETWTGDSETECHTRFELLQEEQGKKTFRCLRSGLKIVILKSTEEELKNPDEMGSTFFRMPGV